VVTRGRLETGRTWTVTTVELPMVNTTEPTQTIMMFKWTVQFFFSSNNDVDKKMFKEF
jgi:hypothetical protein